jgi:predicted TIM-barrel fold metal-dependent hydrolase
VSAAIVCSLDALCRRDPGANASLGELQRSHPSVLYGLATVDPMTANAPATLESALVEHKLLGLKLNPRLQGFDPLAPEVVPLIEVCCALDLPIMIHCGVTHIETHPSTLGRLARRHRGARFLFAHMGGMNSHLVVDEATAVDNVWLETSVSRHVYDPVARAVQRLGSSRVLFGSDLPFGSLQVELYRVLASDLDDKDLARVLGANANEFFGLDLEPAMKTSGLRSG